MNILFMCVANSARSQMAEGLARQIFPNACIESAGSKPGSLNPFAVQVMNEIGIDISKHYSKSYDDLKSEFLAELNFVITLCAEEVCPVIITKNAKKLHWPFADPATQEPMSDEAMLIRFRSARDGIQKKLIELKREIQK